MKVGMKVKKINYGLLGVGKVKTRVYDETYGYYWVVQFEEHYEILKEVELEEVWYEKENH